MDRNNEMKLSCRSSQHSCGHNAEQNKGDNRTSAHTSLPHPFLLLCSAELMIFGKNASELQVQGIKVLRIRVESFGSPMGDSERVGVGMLDGLID